MKREEISSGAMDDSKKAIMRREGCGYYNEETVSKPQIVRTQKNITSFVSVKAAEVKNQEPRLLKQWLTFLEKKQGTNNFVCILFFFHLHFISTRLAIASRILPNHSAL